MKWSEVVAAHREMGKVRTTQPSWALLDFAFLTLGTLWFGYADQLFGVPVWGLFAGFWAMIFAAYPFQIWLFILRGRFLGQAVHFWGRGGF